MNTKTKAFLGAALMAVVSVAVNTYVPESQREHMLAAGATAVGFVLGWLGLSKPGQA